MPQPQRVVVPLDSQDQAAWDHALAYAFAIGSDAEPPTQDYVLLTHTKQQLKFTSLAGFLGERGTKQLLGGMGLPVEGGGLLRHATQQTLRGAARGAVIIAYYADDRMLEGLDGLAGVAGIVAVPDLPNDVDDWIARWNPFVDGSPHGAPATLIADRVVENALTALSGIVNLSHSILNPRDKGHADETLRILRAKGHVLEPGDIKSWAIRNGWQPGAADELAKLAVRIGALKSKPPLTQFHNPDGKYARWSA